VSDIESPDDATEQQYIICELSGESPKSTSELQVIPVLTRTYPLHRHDGDYRYAIYTILYEHRPYHSSPAILQHHIIRLMSRGDRVCPDGAKRSISIACKNLAVAAFADAAPSPNRTIDSGGLDTRCQLLARSGREC